VTTREAREREIELAQLVTIVEPALTDDRVPDAAPRDHCRTPLVRDFRDTARDFWRIELRDEGHARLGNRGLLGRYVGEPVAEELLVIEREVCDRGNQRVLNNVRGVQSAAKPDFKNAGIRRYSGECQKGRGCRHLEKTRLDTGPRIEDLAKQSGQGLVIDELAGNPDALVEANEVGACEYMDLVSAGFERGSQESDGRALAVRSSDVEYRRQPILGPSEPLKNRGDPLEAEAVSGGRELREAIELRFHARVS
jgi:hypothetical protein